MGGIAGACGGLLDKVSEHFPSQLHMRLPKSETRSGGMVAFGNQLHVMADSQSLPGACRAFLIQEWTRTDHASSYNGRPVVSASGQLVLTMDGTIFNIPELRTQLTSEGINVAYGDEGKVLLAGFEKWGAKFLGRLVGQFGIALLDTASRKLLLARDSVGIKTVYVHSSADGFCYSSYIPALLEWSHIPRIARPDFLYSFLRHGVTPNDINTMYRDIDQIPAGHYLSIDIDNPASVTEIEFSKIATPDQIDVSFEEATQTVRELFLNSIYLNQRSASRPGASLSGGMDSTAIVMGLRNVLGEEASIDTFSYVAEGHDAINEEPWIDLVNAKALSIPHKVSPSGSEFVREIEAVTRSYGEPLAGTSYYVQRRVCELVRKSGVSVVLDGVGGDGITAGHDYYLTDHLYGMVRSGRFMEAGKFIATMLKNPNTRSSKRVLMQAFAHLPPAVQRLIRPLTGQPIFPDWMDKAWFKNRGVIDDIYFAPGGLRSLQEHMINTLRGDFLIRYAERSAASIGIESRLPFLDRDLGAYITSLPANYIIGSDGNGRRVFREAMKGISPAEILNRNDKLGFRPPENEWLTSNTAWVNNTLYRGREAGLPIGHYFIPDDLASQPLPRTSLIRCATASIWAMTFNVSFE